MFNTSGRSQSTKPKVHRRDLFALFPLISTRLHSNLFECCLRHSGEGTQTAQLQPVVVGPDDAMSHETSPGADRSRPPSARDGDQTSRPPSRAMTPQMSGVVVESTESPTIAEPLRSSSMQAEPAGSFSAKLDPLGRSFSARGDLPPARSPSARSDQPSRPSSSRSLDLGKAPIT